MRILVCDDEKEFASLIDDRVRRILDAQGVEYRIDVCTDSALLLKEIPAYDMAFLDIEMQPLNGIEVAHRLQNANAHIILFMITSFNRYLDDAMDLHVFRYLSKPMQEERLAAGIQKALDLMQQTTVDLFLSDRGETVHIKSDEIQYLEILNRKTKVVVGASSVTSNHTLREWQSMLPKQYFYLVHGSFIVNVRCVKKYTREQIEDALYNYYRLLERAGTGGSGYRYLYSRFLSQCAELFQDETLAVSAENLVKAADQWRTFSLNVLHYKKKMDITLNEMADVLDEAGNYEYLTYSNIKKNFLKKHKGF